MPARPAAGSGQPLMCRARQAVSAGTLLRRLLSLLPAGSAAGGRLPAAEQGFGAGYAPPVKGGGVPVGRAPLPAVIRVAGAGCRTLLVLTGCPVVSVG